MRNPKEIYLDLIDKERNIYQLSELFQQKRKKVDSYFHLLKDPYSHNKLNLVNNKLEGDNNYEIVSDIPNFTEQSINSLEWKKLNNQFLNYHN